MIPGFTDLLSVFFIKVNTLVPPRRSPDFSLVQASAYELVQHNSVQAPFYW